MATERDLWGNKVHKCEACGRTIYRKRKSGRPPKYCGAACKQRAYRRRHDLNRYGETGDQWEGPARTRCNPHRRSEAVREATRRERYEYNVANGNPTAEATERDYGGGQ